MIVSRDILSLRYKKLYMQGVELLFYETKMLRQLLKRVSEDG